MRPTGTGSPTERQRSLAATAISFLETLQKLALLPGAEEQQDYDLKIIYKWLGAQSQPLSGAQRAKWQLTYISYIALGYAPSLQTQAFFKDMAFYAAVEKWSVAPLTAEIISVLDRLHASDQEIIQKRGHDFFQLYLNVPNPAPKRYSLKWFHKILTMPLLDLSKNPFHDDLPRG